MRIINAISDKITSKKRFMFLAHSDKPLPEMSINGSLVKVSIFTFEIRILYKSGVSRIERFVPNRRFITSSVRLGLSSEGAMSSSVMAFSRHTSFIASNSNTGNCVSPSNATSPGIFTKPLMLYPRNSFALISLSARRWPAKPLPTIKVLNMSLRCLMLLGVDEVIMMRGI